MQTGNLIWWLILFLNFVGYLILRFGIISNGLKKEEIKALGTLLTTLSFVLMFIFFGLGSSFILLIILWFAVTPLVMMIIGKLEKRLYPYRSKMEQKWSEKLNVPVEEIKRVGQMDDADFWEEMRKKYKWLNSQ